MRLHDFFGSTFISKLKFDSPARRHTKVILREGPFSQGASWVVCGSGVPVVRFFKFVWYFRKIGKPYFLRETAEKRLDLKSLKRQTKAEELEDPVPELVSLRLSLKAL